MPDRRIDEESRKRLGEIAAGYMKLDRRVIWHLRALVAVVFVSACLFTYLLARQSDVSDRNQQAIRVGCVLLSNAIVQSGASSAGTSARRTQLFIAAARRSMTPKERAEFDSLAPGGPPTLDIPDCDRIAKHPDSVHAQPVPQP